MRIDILKKLKKLPKRAGYLFLAFLVALTGLSWWRPQRAHAQTDTFTTSGSWTVPAGVTSAVFEAWGGGGAGGAGSTNGTGGGGGAGGQYAKTTLTGLVSSNAYPVTVSTTTAGGTGNGSAGGDSGVTSPSSAQVVLAKGGAGGATTNGSLFPSGGFGSTTGGVGDFVFAGGSGSGGSTSSATSGAGAGGAGSGGNGGDATGATAGTGTATNGGTGGAGVTGNAVGLPGNNYGGGGGGASKSGGANKSGGTGAQGLITVTYTGVSNSPPNGSTNSSPSDGSTVLSTTPSLQMTTTDPEGDTVKYKVWLYSGATVDGFGSCSGIFINSFDQNSSGVGWDNGTTAYTSGATATYTVQSALTRGLGYCWQSQAKDPGGSNTFGNISTATTFIVDSKPGSPTLITPSSGDTGISTTPSFTLRTTDPDNDYLQYRIYLYQSDCSTAVGASPFDMSGAGWTDMDANGSTAYVGSSSLTSSTVATYTYQGSLSPSTTYCWKADAVDPGGSNTYSVASATQSFTTVGASSSVNIGGGATIRGGTAIQ
jgi:hypothetical protein